jgi:hypothetical protein
MTSTLSREHIALRKLWWVGLCKLQNSVSNLFEQLRVVVAHQVKRGGKCPEISTVFALKHAHLPRIMNIGTKFPEKAASHLGYQHRRL